MLMRISALFWSHTLLFLSSGAAGATFEEDVFGEYCMPIETASECQNTCAPYQKNDSCDSTQSFTALIKKRTKKGRNDPESVLKDGHFFHILEDKLAGYVFSSAEKVPAPSVYCCRSNFGEAELQNCLTSSVPSEATRFVIKATNLHSNQGVYALVKDPSTSMLYQESITGATMSIADISAELHSLRASTVIVEEYIGTKLDELPKEVKFHLMDGNVAAIDVTQGAGTACACSAVIDKDQNRMDQYGCFSHKYKEEATINIQRDRALNAIKIRRGRELIEDTEIIETTNIQQHRGLEVKERRGRNLGARALKARRGLGQSFSPGRPVYNEHLYLCNDVEKIDPRVMQEMIDIAEDLSKKIGAYIRIDMFLVGDKIYVQEYSTNHLNGLHVCAAKKNQDDGSIDSCFMGRTWDNAGGFYGGPGAPVPAYLDGFHNLSPQEQCALVTGTQP